ncbi:MAG: hypothetical protein EAZ89_19330 [Bacteroidetes bacterium]|nr:MAG: hypothetical protein EAZ89_19330 [Bacteroidota bacterium]
MEAYSEHRTACSNQFILSASRGGSYVLEIKDENLLYAGPSTSTNPVIRSFYNFQDTVCFSGKKLFFTQKNWVFKRSADRER